MRRRTYRAHGRINRKFNYCNLIALLSSVHVFAMPHRGDSVREEGGCLEANRDCAQGEEGVEEEDAQTIGSWRIIVKLLLSCLVIKIIVSIRINWCKTYIGALS
jgi:hypothetical protein